MTEHELEADGRPEKSLLVLPEAVGWHDEHSILVTADCGHRAWMARSSREVHEASPDLIDTVCLRCFGGTEKVLEALLGGRSGHVPTAERDVRTALNQSEADQVMSLIELGEALRQRREQKEKGTP